MPFPVLAALAISAVGTGIAAAFAPDPHAPESQQSRASAEKIRRVSKRLGEIRAKRMQNERSGLREGMNTLVTADRDRGDGMDVDPEEQMARELRAGQETGGGAHPNFTGDRSTIATTGRVSNPGRFAGQGSRQPLSVDDRGGDDDEATIDMEATNG